MRTGGELKALLAVKTQNPDPRAPELTSFLTLAEGARQGVGAGDKRGVVELVKIHAEEEKVDIINSGTPVTLSFKEDGFNSPKASPAVRNAAVVVHKTPALPVPKPDEDSSETPGINAESSADGGSAAADGPPAIAAAPPVNGGASSNPYRIIVGGTAGPAR